MIPTAIQSVDYIIMNLLHNTELNIPVVAHITIYISFSLQTAD